MAAPPERSVANGGYWQTYLKLPQFPGRIGPALPLSSYSFGFFPGSVILDFPGKNQECPGTASHWRGHLWGYLRESLPRKARNSRPFHYDTPTMTERRDQAATCRTHALEHHWCKLLETRRYGAVGLHPATSKSASVFIFALS
jgi:hypothetical protein